MANWNITVLANDYQGIEHTMPYFNDARYYCQSLGKPIITMIDRAEVLSFLLWVDSQAATASHCKCDTTVSEVRVLLYPPYVGIGEVVNTVRCERIIQECKSLISTQNNLLGASCRHKIVRYTQLAHARMPLATVKLVNTTWTTINLYDTQM